MEFPSLKTWFEGTENYPFIIAGPCSAESEDQVISIAKFLHSTGKVNIFRAGVWKPRTRPGTFNGIGVKALRWLQRVQAHRGLSETWNRCSLDGGKDCFQSIFR